MGNGPAGQYSWKIRFIEKPGVQEEGGLRVAKPRSYPRQAYPEVSLQGRDLMGVVGIVAPFAPLGVGTGESLPQSQTSGTGPSASCGYCCPLCPTGVGTQGKVVLSRPRGKVGRGDMCRVPLAAVRYGEPGKLQGRDRKGTVEGSCWYRAHGVSIRVKFVLSRNLVYKTKGVEGYAMWLNVVLIPGKPIQKSNFRDGTYCELWILLPPFAPLGVGIQGQFVLLSPRGEIEHR